MRTRLLQLIHISDLHFRKRGSDRAALRERLIARKVRDLVEKHGIAGWHEGTLGHDQTAVTAFRKWLLALRQAEPGWFNDPDTGQTPQTWLVDTGDATTFGDRDSLAEARMRINEFRDAIKPCRLRTIYGNHDAWPDTQPAFRSAGYAGHMKVQREKIAEWTEWKPDSYARSLRVEIAGTPAFIECHALDTVSFDFMDNVAARGRVDQDALDALVGRLQAAPHGGLHIVAMHHPLVFPYEKAGSQVIETMVLCGASEVIRRLRNDVGEPDGQGRTPLAHLFLSGHTHLCHPGVGLPQNLQTLYQGELSTSQAQFVAGSLLLPRDFKKVRANAQPTVTSQANEEFALPQVYDATQQFELLRFFFDDDYQDGLMVERYVLMRNPAGGDYRVVPELSNATAAFMGL